MKRKDARSSADAAIMGGKAWSSRCSRHALRDRGLPPHAYLLRDQLANHPREARRESCWALACLHVRDEQSARGVGVLTQAEAEHRERKAIDAADERREGDDTERVAIVHGMWPALSHERVEVSLLLGRRRTALKSASGGKHSLAMRLLPF